MSYPLSEIAEIITADFSPCGEDIVVETLLTDSRKLMLPQTALFFALPGETRSGFDFISSLYTKGVRAFVVDESFRAPSEKFSEVNFLFVIDVLQALQDLAAFHRLQFSYPVIGITGSNGKTIVKEWLNQLLSEDYHIIRSPKSYNSQTGVPLSVWRMGSVNNLAIFEAGISSDDEMEKLEKIIRPNIGVITSFGVAHAEGFSSAEQKINEKIKLFSNSTDLIYHADNSTVSAAIDSFRIAHPGIRLFSVSRQAGADLYVESVEKLEDETRISLVYGDKYFSASIPFSDDASVQNALSCIAVMFVLRVLPEIITQRILHLRPVEMRLVLKQAINNCSLIDDAYSADLSSLDIALNFLDRQKQHEKRTVILSDFLQSGREPGVLYKKIARLLLAKKVQRFIGIGPEISAHSEAFIDIDDISFFTGTESFIETFSVNDFDDETILLKGARIFRFEKIANLLEQKLHGTRMEINLNSLRHNLRIYRQLLSPGVKIMAMVKAFSYGSGSFEVAGLLEDSGVEYLAVAYADEGADLRRSGSNLPIMVMNPESSGFENIIKYKLEPELFSFHILNDFIKFLRTKKIEEYPVHIKIDSGMHRLGFEGEDAKSLAEILNESHELKLISVFSHLAGSDAEDHNDFTSVQTATFTAAADEIHRLTGLSFMRHISNSSAVFRHPDLQMDMVRLGIGLYGVDSSRVIQDQLLPVACLKTTISQIRKIAAGESVGYSRRGIAEKNSVIATVRIGYADGYPRILSNGKGRMMVNGLAASVIGNICMDMTMINVTGIDAAEGDEVTVFGDEPSVSDVAAGADTISYEILTNISQRVKRVYFEE